MNKNGEAIYETNASPFQNLDWGRCTQKLTGSDTRLYLHVFDWPEDTILKVPGIFNMAKSAYLLADNNKASLNVTRHEDALWIALPAQAPDTMNTVVVLEIEGKPDVSYPPVVQSDFSIFIDNIQPKLTSVNGNFEIRYTTDGSLPSIESDKYTGNLTLTETTLLSARCFRDGKPASDSVCATFTKVKPLPPAKATDIKPGIRFNYYEGDWDSLPDFAQLTPVKSGIINNFNLSEKIKGDYYGFVFEGFVHISNDGIYNFMTDSDDGSRLFIDGIRVVDNDGLHGMVQEKGETALAKGYHAIKVIFFEKGGQDDLKVYIKESGKEGTLISDNALFY